MTSNQYRVYYKGLRKRPTYEGLINYLANEQEMIQYPNRTAKHMRNHPYLTQLDGNEYDHMTEQQLNILRAKMNEDKINEQAAKPGGPGTNELRAGASAVASSSSSGSSSYESIASSSQASTPRRPFFLPPSGSAPSGIPPRGSVVAIPESHDIASSSSSRSSVASSPHLQDDKEFLRAQNAEVEQLERQYKEEEEAKKRGIERMAGDIVDNMVYSSVDIVMKKRQEQEAERQEQQRLSIAAKRREQQQQEGGSKARSFSPAHRGKTIQAPSSQRSSSVTTFADIQKRGEASGSKVIGISPGADRGRLSTQPETKDVVIYDATKKVYDNKGKEKVTIEDKLKYYSDKMRNRTTAEQNLVKIGVPESEFKHLSLKDMVKLWLERYTKPDIQKHKEQIGLLAKTGASSSTGR